MGVSPMGVDGARRLAQRGREADAGASVPPAPIELAFRGRAQELEQMRRALRALAGGVAVRQLIAGEQGIGKSRLLAEALSRTNVEGIVVQAGRALEFESDRAFGALIDALELRSDAPHSAQAALGERIAHATRRSSDAEKRHEVAGEIVDLVKALTDAAPIALVVEDVQWADRFTAMTLARLVTECADRPLGVVLTRRVLPLHAPIDDLLAHGRPLFDHIELDALDPEVIALLAHDFLGAAPGPRLQEHIDGAGGNPAMLLALLHGWQRAGALRRAGDSIDTDAVFPPQDMRPAVLTRCARLSERCQNLLTAAAIFERPFGVATLAAIAQRSVIDVLGDLREAIAARLLLEVAGVLSFRHELVRQILYEATPVSARAELHRQIAQALSRDGGSPALVGHHQLRAAELSSHPVAEHWPAEQHERTTLRWELLTKTERQVALLVARGLSNKQAGARLQVSARTIETHLAHVFAKLGINSRVELAGAVARASLDVSKASGVNGAAVETELRGQPQPDRSRGALPAQ